MNRTARLSTWYFAQRETDQTERTSDAGYIHAYVQTKNRESGSNRVLKAFFENKVKVQMKNIGNFDIALVNDSVPCRK